MRYPRSCISCGRCSPDQRDPEATSPVDEEIKVGDYVRLRRLNYHGEVISLSKNKAVVLANGMKMNVKCDELEKMQPPGKEKEGKGYRKPSSSSFPLECKSSGHAWVMEALGRGGQISG